MNQETIWWNVGDHHNINGITTEVTSVNDQEIVVRTPSFGAATTSQMVDDFRGDGRIEVFSDTPGMVSVRIYRQQHVDFVQSVFPQATNIRVWHISGGFRITADGVGDVPRYQSDQIRDYFGSGNTDVTRFGFAEDASVEIMVFSATNF